ncbi:MAG: LacI family DNA-binding transcriptional regulator [Streptosporangiaceae bacterium]
MHQTRRATLQDVADRAGVSLTTASRVVNEGSRRVGPRLADRVKAAAAELGYTANLQARAVATGQSTMVGVVVHDISDPYFSSIAAGLIEVADARGLLVCISSAAAAEAAEREYVALMRAQRARAVILIGSRTDDAAARDALRAEIAAFTHGGGRVVAVGQDLLDVDTVLPQNAAGAEALARAMVALGHRRFAVLAGPRGLLTARDRLDGFRAGLAAWGVPPGTARVIHGPFTRDGGYEAMSALLAAAPSDPLPDCVFAVTDVMAMGALARLRAGGLSVPADIALAGFDDISTLRDVYPPVTTVRLPLKRMGEMAAELVLSEAAPETSTTGPETGTTAPEASTTAPEAGATPRPRVIPVPGEVILRESTLPHPPTR